jgi:hypothetical protein
MSGWGDHEWGPDPWGGCSILTPLLKGFILYWDDDESSGRLGPELCERGVRFPFENEPAGQALCWLVPEFMCNEDLDPSVGGTGDWHRLLAVIYDWLFGTPDITGLVDDVASWACIYDCHKAPDKFLDALLLHLGFNLKLPLTTAEKRKIIKLLVRLYGRKGSAPGIEEALLALLGIPAVVIPGAGLRFFEGFEAGEDVETTLTPVSTGVDFVRVTNPHKFEVGQTFTITDTTAPFFDFPDIEILSIIADRITFAPQTLGGVIEAGADVWCNRACDQVAKIGLGPGDCAEIGIDVFNPQDPGLYTFHVDVQRTVATVTDLNDGDTSVEITDLDFIVPNARVRLTDLTAPLEPVTVVTVKTVDRDTNIITFDAVSLIETIEAGAAAINLFSAEEIELIRRVVEFARPSHTHFFITRDLGDALAEVG